MGLLAAALVTGLAGIGGGIAVEAAARHRSNQRGPEGFSVNP